MSPANETRGKRLDTRAEM